MTQQQQFGKTAKRKMTTWVLPMGFVADTGPSATPLFEAYKEAFILQSEIGKRASELADRLGFKYKQMTAMMDIGACHSNGNPLRLADLLESDEANFAHDVFGIRANIDRTTGKLMNCFVPRYSECQVDCDR